MDSLVSVPYLYNKYDFLLLCLYSKVVCGYIVYYQYAWVKTFRA